MGKFGQYFQKTFARLRGTLLRFALVPAFLVMLTALVSFQIENTFKDSTLTITRLIFTAILGAFLCTALEFLAERFKVLIKFKWLLQAASVLIAILYYLVLTSTEKNNMIMIVRLLVICFALLAFYIWIPAFRKHQDFSANALIHFKSFFVSALYSLVLTLGLLAIYFAIDLLLVKLDDKIPGHISNIMGTFFFPIYYLSLLPRFNSEDEENKAKTKLAANYPRFLEILVSYIALPLITVFTVVLVIYLLKILITMEWPVGELGPMVLGYSSVGLLLHVLCGRLTNRFAVVYTKFFPIALIPLVGFQLYSVFIRINAYGVTESRYYLVLFGIYSIVCALYLILTKNLKPGAIAILAACFAILSVIPPVDAFTMSLNSQSSRIESIFDRNHMLQQGKVVPGSNVSEDDKIEITNITGYFERMGHNSRLTWLPADYEYYRDFDKVYGFSQTYSRGNQTPDNNTYFNANVDQRLPLDVSGYETMLRTSIYNNGTGKIDSYDFKLGGIPYRLDTERTANNDITFTILDASGSKLSGFSAMPLMESLKTMVPTGDKGLVSPEKLTYNIESPNFRIRIIFQNLSFRIGPDNSISEINGESLVLIGKK